MPVLINAFPVSLPSGSIEIGPVDVPNNVHTAILRIRRMTTAAPQFWNDPATHIQVDLYVSVDGGAFQHIAGFGSEGGIVFGKDGKEAEFSTLSIIIPRVNNRQAKAVVSVVNGPLVTEVTLSVN